MSLSEELLSQIHRFLQQNQYPNDTQFCRSVTDATEALIHKGRLAPRALAARIALPSAYRRRRVKKLNFAKQVVASVTPVASRFADRVRTDVHAFMQELKHMVRRDVWKDIYNKGVPQEKPGRDAIRAALFGFFAKSGLVFHELPSGRGYIDILVARGLVQVVVETKLSENFVGIQQLREYLLDDPDKREGYFFLFDTTANNRFRSYCDVEAGMFPGTTTIHTLVSHVNLPIPSRKKVS